MLETALWQKIRTRTHQPEYRDGIHRANPPEQTLELIAPILSKAGITRLADVTGLDYIGIPTYQAIRPNSRNLSVSQGKGATRDQAKISALMESLEFFHAEWVREERVFVTLADIRAQLPYDPGGLLRPSWGKLHDSLLIEWVRATNLATGRATWVPVQLCELNAVISERLAAIHFLPASNGLASGNTFCEAIVHALCEVVERDAVARDDIHRFDRAYTVRLETVTSKVALRLVEKFHRAGGHIHIHVPRSPTRLPCFEVFLETEDIPHITFFGAGCATRRDIALVRALTEVAQSRVTHIAGSRDDLDYRHYPGPGELPPSVAKPRWPDGGDISYEEIPEFDEVTLLEEFDALVTLIRYQTGVAPMAVDLSRPEFGLPVVYVVAPELRINHYKGLT